MTERTLRYYDRQGLLSPSKRNENGHRFYTEQDLLQLQKILTLKFLDFSLEDIANNLSKTDASLQQTLLMQYDLLKQKQDQINRVIETLDRMRRLSEDCAVIDSDLLLMYIHNVRNEQLQKDWLAKQLPNSDLFELFFMENKSLEEKIDIEKRITFVIMQFKSLYKQNKRPDDKEAIDLGIQFLRIVEDIIGPLRESVTPEFLEQVDHIEQLDLSNVLFPTGLSKEEEDFILEILEQLEEYKVFKGDFDHEHDE